MSRTERIGYELLAWLALSPAVGVYAYLQDQARLRFDTGFWEAILSGFAVYPVMRVGLGWLYGARRPR